MSQAETTPINRTEIDLDDSQLSKTSSNFTPQVAEDPAERGAWDDTVQYPLTDTDEEPIPPPERQQHNPRDYAGEEHLLEVNQYTSRPARRLHTRSALLTQIIPGCRWRFCTRQRYVCPPFYDA